MTPDPHHLVLAQLREEIRRLEHRPGRRDGIVACGLAAVDEILPAGGFPRGALSELAGGPASGKTAVALSLLRHLGPDDLFAWVDGRGELYPPAAAARGVDLGRLLVVRPPMTASGSPPPGAEAPWRSALWASEALLASGAFAAVVMDVPLPLTGALAGADAVARRLQAAAERGGAVGLWLARPHGPPRVVALVVPDLPLQRITRSREPADVGARPVAVTAEGRVLCRDAAARAAGVRAGATVAEALAACGRLAVVATDPVADRAALRALADAMLGLVPAVELYAPDALLLDAGAAHLLAPRRGGGPAPGALRAAEELLARRALAIAEEMG